MYILYRLQPQLAVPCFGVSEYHNNADESWICTETTTIISIRVGEIFNKSNEFQKMLWIKNKYSKFEIQEMAANMYPSVY